MQQRHLDPRPALATATWTVSGPGLAPVTVIAENWLSALGRALHLLDADWSLGRLAAEVLPNGTVIANDVGGGRRYVVARS